MQNIFLRDIIIICGQAREGIIFLRQICYFYVAEKTVPLSQRDMLKNLPMNSLFSGLDTTINMKP